MDVSPFFFTGNKCLMSGVLGGSWPQELWCGEGRTLRHQQGTGGEAPFLKGQCHKIRDSLLLVSTIGVLEIR